MTPQRWQQVKTILAEAIERNDVAQRAVFVESACAGDPLLRQEVETLLAYADFSSPGDDFLPRGPKFVSARAPRPAREGACAPHRRSQAEA